MIGENGKKQIQFWLGILVSVACLAAILLIVEPAKIGAALRDAEYGYLALAAVGILLFLVLRAIRWRFMLGSEVSLRQVFHIQNIGYLLTYLLPFRIGDVARAVLIGNVPPITLPQGLSTMVVERVFDLLFIVTLLPLTLAEVGTLPPRWQTAARLSGLLALLAVAILVVAANQRERALRLLAFLLDRIPTFPWKSPGLLRFLPAKATVVQRADELLAGLDSLTRLRDGLLLASLSVLLWLPIIFAYYASMLAVHLEPTVAMAAFVVCAAALSIAAPSSPGQVGVFHAGVTFALVQILGQPQAESASFAFLYHALNFAVVIVVGIAGIYGIEATLGNIIASTRALMSREKAA